MSTSRNKENYRPSSSVRARSSIPSLIKSPEKEELFTNSILGLSDASQTSLIPSPQKLSAATLSKPRRKIATKPSSTNLQDQPRSISRASHSNSPAPSSSGRQTPSTRSLSKQRSYLPVKRQSTPPPSNDDFPLPSPASTASSPPRALTDVYQRIEQEADLADTEGQISDPDDLTSDDRSAGLSKQENVSRALFPEATSSRSLSRGPTPTPERSARVRNGFVGDTVEVMSDPTTGMSFFDQMEDRELAAKLTPMALDSARAREALRRQWSDQKPIAFQKAGKSTLNGFQPMSAEFSTINGSTRPIAFAKANKSRLPSELAQAGHHQRTHSDVTDRIDRQSLENGINGWESHEQNGSRPLTSLPLNPRLKRPHYFSRTHGFPARSENLGENASHEVSATEKVQTRSDSPLTVSTRHSDPIDYDRVALSQNHKSWLESSREKENFASRNGGANLPSKEFDEMTQASSEIDWNGAANNTSLPPTGQRSLVRSRSFQFNNQTHYSSPIQSRRWENDFTGTSFQVSESPPVKNRILGPDKSRDREIEGLAKAAVTTNRLSQLRERESQESLYRSSKLPLPQTSPVAASESNAMGTNPENPSGGRQLTNSSPNADRKSSSRNNTSPNSEPIPERPSSDRSNSHDLLQRIAKESGSTPRSSTSPGTITKESISRALGKPMFESQPHRSTTGPLASKAEGSESQRSIANPQGQQTKVEQTPKVAGAWTDTILPDTVKTVRQPQKHSKYAQTPHVSAGGWVNTPFVPGLQQELPMVVENSQEISDIPEELMNGIVKDSASDRTVRAEAAVTETDEARQVDASGKDISKSPASSMKLLDPKITTTEAFVREMPKSIAQKVLLEQKQKHEKHGFEKAVEQENDSLNLGNATLQSLEDLLDIKDEDLTTLSRIGDNSLQFEAFAPANLSEAEVLERLGSKLDRLRTNIHDARKGISKLEHQVSESQESQTAAPNRPSSDLTATVQQTSIKPSSGKSLPATLLNSVLPVHLLFHPRRKDLGQRLPRLTWFGWLTLCLWSWYFLETLMCELFSHPTFAEVYVWPTKPEPSFPFVLPTMIWRWCQMDTLQPYLLTPVKQFGVGIYRTLAMWAGLIDGFADDRWSSLIATATQAAFGAAKTMTLGDEPDLSMMTDEFL